MGVADALQTQKVTWGNGILITDGEVTHQISANSLPSSLTSNEGQQARSGLDHRHGLEELVNLDIQFFARNLQVADLRHHLCRHTGKDVPPATRRRSTKGK